MNVGVINPAGQLSASATGALDKALLRPPEVVCRLTRMGAAFPTRLSFMRILVRRMATENWQISCERFELDNAGYGTAVYTVSLPGQCYSLVVFANPLADSDRTDRVIASAWDAAFVLFDGIPGEADIDRLRQQAPLQEAGRFQATELVLSRANRSLRLFEYTCDCLADGRQPEPQRLMDVGYLMRTTAVYGNGKFGVSDRSRIATRPETQNSFGAEMLTVYLIRLFTFDQLEHIARQRSPETAVSLDRDLKRLLGIGNATGLGMAPFVVSHPELLHQWFAAREIALSRVRAMSRVEVGELQRAEELRQRVLTHLAQWRVDDPVYQARNQQLSDDLTAFGCWLDDAKSGSTDLGYLWDILYRWTQENLSLDAQELLVALMLELYPECTDDLEDMFHIEKEGRLDVTMPIEDFRELVSSQYDWTADFDFSDAKENTHFWYVSENKLEPRFGVREEEQGADREMPVAIARDMTALRGDLAQALDGTTVAEFLFAYPQHRHLVRRVQALGQYPYGEIRDNLLANTCSPLDILRFKLAFFGAVKFDPKSSLWTRICMYQGAPLPDELDSVAVDDWWLAIWPGDTA
jgi:hypothetical protein